MDELAQKVTAARQRLSVELGGDRLAALEQRFDERLARRAKMRIAGQVGLGLAAAAAIALVSVRTFRTHTPDAPRPQAAVLQAPASRQLSVPDGSSITPLDELAVVQVKESSPPRTLIELVRGGARFNVAHNPSRLFRVEAGAVAVDVLGTEFTVERIGPRVRVSVLHGQVQVAWEGKTAQVIEGETGIFPRLKQEDEATAATEDAPPAASSTAAPWRSLAARRDFHGAYAALKRDHWNVPNNAADLLLSADVARMSNHPAEAVPLLRRVIAQYPSDPRVPAAAFTLGRVLMEIGSPREAAAAFAKSGALDRQGTITEDALAREVEAWSRAGDAARARRRAEEYVARYPSGLRIQAVRQYGGL